MSQFWPQSFWLSAGTCASGLHRRRHRFVLFRRLAALACATAALSHATASPWKFIMTGDSRGSSVLDPVNTNIMSELVTAIVSENPDVLIFPGDLVYAGSEDAFRQWTNVVAPVYNASIGVYPIRGNHDLVNDPDGAAWASVFGAAVPTNGPAGEVGFTYSFVHKNALFIGLDEYVVPHRVNQPWLAEQLAANRLPHVFVFGHEPAFKALHADCLDDYPAGRDAFWTSLADSGVVLYLTGHDHFYDHVRIDDGDGNPSNDLHQIIAGTAGGPLYDFNGVYAGENGRWTPKAVFHDKEFGYVVVQVDENNVTMTWKRRATTNAFVAAEVFTYSTDQFSPNHFVSPSGSNLWPYLRWQNAATNLQSAVDAAGDGDTVLVDDGVYLLSQQIEITNKAIVMRSLHGPGSTTVDGNNTTRCFYVGHSNAVVDGFSITRGRGTGGGVFMDRLGEVRNCVVSGNSTPDSGGGVCCYGGGLVRNCLVVSNSASGCGGGIAVETNGIVENCTITGNSGGACGGGLSCIGDGISGIRVRNSVLYGNAAATGSNYCNSGSGMDYSFCCAIPFVGGTSNIDVDPLFVAPSSGDYHLQTASPCIDTATNIGGVGMDLDRVTRPLDGDANGEARWDMGCYEFVHPAADTDHDGMRDADEVIAGTDATDAAGRFRLAGMSVISTNTSIWWESALDRRYAVVTTTDLVSAAWTNVADPVFTNLVGTGRVLLYTNAYPTDCSRYFRLRVWHE